MQYDYFIYMFLFICFIYGIYRGIKKEISFFIAFSLSLFVCIYFYDKIKNLICTYVNTSDLYLKMEKLLSYVNISEGYLEFIICGLSVFIILNLLLNGILYLIFFKGRKRMMKIITSKQRFFGGALGLIVGIELSIIMVILLNGIIPLDYSGMISNLLVNKIPYINNIILSTTQIMI